MTLRNHPGLDAYDFIRWCLVHGDSFTQIASEFPMWYADDPNQTPLTVKQLKDWYDYQTFRLQNGMAIS